MVFRWPAPLALALVGCTLSHPLDKYGEAYGTDAGPPAGGDADAPDVVISDAATPEGGACAAPTILEPTVGMKVGPSIHLRVSAPTCLTSLIVYLDSKEILQVSASTIDQWVPVTVGTHTIGVNGWTGSGPAHVSMLISFTRPN